MAAISRESDMGALRDDLLAVLRRLLRVVEGITIKNSFFQ